MIKELLFEGSNRYYDQALCSGLNVTDEDIDALCKAMKEQAVRNARIEEQEASIKDVGRKSNEYIFQKICRKNVVKPRKLSAKSSEKSL